MDQGWDLREKVGSLKPIPTSTHGSVKPNVPDRLTKAKFVFIRSDARRNPLQTLYEGPYAVISKSDKYFTVQLGNRQDNVSIDRLKAAEIDEQLPVPVAQPPRRGRPPAGPVAQRDVPGSPRPLPVQAMPQLPVRAMPHLPVSATLQLPFPPPKPTYAEVTTQAGRTTRLPQRFTN